MIRLRCSSLFHTINSILVPVRFHLSISMSTDKVKHLAAGLIHGDRYSLAQSITLLESTNPQRRLIGQKILDKVMQHLNEKEEREGQFSFRIGLSGPPGAGKSTFIEAFGNRLTGSIPWEVLDRQVPNLINCGDDDNNNNNNISNRQTDCSVDGDQQIHRLAVLAVDPSSQATGGSLLADKTRMPELSTNSNAYIRPSPSGGNLGGVARATNESILLCEGAGYNTIIVETVGVGQSEYAVADMVDMFVFIIPPAGGDELQGLKRGIVEVADLVLVNKADGDLFPAARRIAREYSNALKYMRHRKKNWRPKAWMWTYVREGLWNKFKNNSQVQAQQTEIEQLVVGRYLAPGLAAEKLIKLYTKSLM